MQNSGSVMAVSTIHFALLCLISAFASVCEMADTRVTITAPANPVINGGILAVQCHVWNLNDDDTVTIFRVSNERTVQITNGEDIVRPSQRLNVFLSKQTLVGGSVIYFVTIVGVSEKDQGEYVCKVFDFTGYIAENSMEILVYSNPSDAYSICTSDPKEPITLNEKSRLELSCSSDTGMPDVDIKWKSTNPDINFSVENTRDGFIMNSQIVLAADMLLNGAVFYCEVTSSDFIDWKRSCDIGPIQVTSDIGFKNDIVRTSKSPIGIERIQGLKGIDNCVECPSDDMLQFYLTIAIAFTAFLAIIFLTSTLILCYKYHHISTVTRREPSRVLTSQQSIEPVYVSLQRRSVNADREYMTLEDPNNPENKIILPKETFDDYCRTMTLKRV